MRLADISPYQQATPHRWIAEQDGLAVGFGAYEPLGGELVDRRKSQLHLYVSPENRGGGIASQLYDQIVNALSATEVMILRTWARQDRAESLKFLSSRGFAEEMQTYHWSLDTQAFDLERLEKYPQRLQKYGYRFQTFTELTSDPGRNRKMYDLYWDVLLDIPSPEPRQVMSFEDYEERMLRHPELFGAHFLALHHGQYVGLCILLPHGRARYELYADTLGIRRAYRGRGIAQALSHCGIKYAKSQGYSLISADNFVGNHGIIALLANLGFGNRTVWILFSKSLKGEASL
jgi:mycothiol synthase